jgi:hypothetical protein
MGLAWSTSARSSLFSPPLLPPLLSLSPLSIWIILTRLGPVRELQARALHGPLGRGPADWSHEEQVSSKGACRGR